MKTALAAAAVGLAVFLIGCAGSTTGSRLTASHDNVTVQFTECRMTPSTSKNAISWMDTRYEVVNLNDYPLVVTVQVDLQRSFIDEASPKQGSTVMKAATDFVDVGSENGLLNGKASSEINFSIDIPVQKSVLVDCGKVFSSVTFATSRA